MDNASISHYHQPEAFIVFLWLVCLSLTLSGKPHLAAVKTVCGVFCELADNVAPADRNSCFLSAWAYPSTTSSFVVFITGTSKRFTGRVKLTPDLHKRRIIRNTKELLKLFFWVRIQLQECY